MQLPEQFYEDPNIISTYDFIYFVQDYSPFLREYLDYLEDENYITADDNGYYNSFIDICNEINTDEGDDGTFETYRVQVEPLMEWMTEECGHMNQYYEENMRNAQEAPPPVVANRTRSKRPATGFELPSAKRGTNMITLEPTKQEGVRIKLSDGKEYTYVEIKGMWQFSQTQTPLRHPYTEEDKQKIRNFIDFVTKGGKRKSRKTKKSKKTRKTKKTKKTRKTRKTRKPKKTIKNRKQ